MSKIVKYIAAQKDVFERGLGGMSHVEGVANSLSKKYRTILVGKSIKLSDDISDRVFKQDVDGGNFYIGIFLNILMDKNSEIFIIRKEKKAILIIILCFIIKRYILNIKFTSIIEVNGISEEFSSKKNFVRKLLRWIEIRAVSSFDVIYAVNENLKERISNLIGNPDKKIIVCENGGGDPWSDVSPVIEDDSETNFIFYGANQSHYHVGEFINSVESGFGDRKFKIILIGYNFERFSRSRVDAPGSMGKRDFYEYISRLPGKKFGLIPLEFVPNLNGVVPIKALDYLRSGLPIICSNNIFPDYPAFVIKYGDSSLEVSSAVRAALDMDKCKYNNMLSKIGEAYADFTWDKTLKPLFEFIDNM
jgi:hypothetical protein